MDDRRYRKPWDLVWVVVKDEAVKLGHLMYPQFVLIQRFLLFLIDVCPVCCVEIALVVLQAVKVLFFGGELGPFWMIMEIERMRLHLMLVLCFGMETKKSVLRSR